MIITTLLLSALAAAPAELTFHEGPLDSAVTAANKQDKGVAVYFWRNGSEHCASMWQETMQNATVVRKLNDIAVLFSADYDSEQGGALFAKYNITTLPTILFLSSEGSPEDAVNGFINHDGLLGEIARIQRGEGTVTGLRNEASESKDGTDESMEIHWKLAGKYNDLGLNDQHDLVLADLREMDPKSRTEIGARAHLWFLRDGIYKSGACSCEGECEEGSCDGAERAALVDIKPLYKHAGRMKLAQARFEAWSAVGNLESYRGDRELACKAFSKAVKDLPAENSVNWPKQMAWRSIEQAKEEELSPREKKFALNMAELCVKKAKILDPMSEDYIKTYGEYDPRYVQAEALTTLAFALELNGREKKALSVAKDVVNLVDSEDFAEALKPIFERAEG